LGSCSKEILNVINIAPAQRWFSVALIVPPLEEKYKYEENKKKIKKRYSSQTKVIVTVC
jgi:hypothetical protein